MTTEKGKADATDLLAMRRALEAFQVARLQRDFADLMAVPEYHLLGAFFFGELYAARDFSERNENAHRLHATLRAVPAVRVESLDRAVRLMDLTAELDAQVAALLLARGDTHFSEEAYEQAYRAANAYAPRVEQIQLLVSVCEDAYQLTRVPLMLWHMRQIRPLADSLGFGALASFLVASLEAMRPVRNLTRFTSTLATRERARLDRIYG